MNSITWKFVNNNVSMNDISNIENTLGIKLPKDYIDCVILNNAGYPDKNIFDIYEEKGKVFEYLLGISKDDEDNILDVYSTCKNFLPKGIIPFARDGFGNYICFNYSDKDKYKIIFYCNENEKMYFISNTFTELINKLY